VRHDTSQSVLFESLSSKPVTVAFEAPSQSSDGGLPLLAAVDRKLGLTALLSHELLDVRRSKSVEHSFTELVRQRVFAIAHGYADCNDAARIGDDPLFKLACGRSTDASESLASQPTLSRFERGHGGREIVAMGRALERAVIGNLSRRHRRARQITIDLDGSEDPTHGQQPFAFFNGYYDSWCYVPIFGFLTIDDLPEQHLFFARLRPGTGPEGHGVRALLRRVVPLLRQRFQRAKIVVRLDAGFASGELFDLFEELKVGYMVAMAKNSRLSTHAERHMRAVRHIESAFGGTTTLFGECTYGARTWSRSRRVIFKAEVVALAGRDPRDNLRFVVTNLRGGPESVWTDYIKRGDTENRIKELKLDLQIDRTSSTSFLANQMRVLLTAAAFVLFQALRAGLAATELGRATVATLRLKLLKIGATVKESWRRIVIALPVSYPWKHLWRRAAIAADAH
jgi:Transposase DDE domain group 1